MGHAILLKVKTASTTAALMLLPAVVRARTEGIVIQVHDPQGAAARVAAPVNCYIDLEELFGPQADPQRLRLVESDETTGEVWRPVPVQFEPESTRATTGKLWWLMPPGDANRRRLRLALNGPAIPTMLKAELDKDRQAVVVVEGGSPVLRYNHGTVPPPPEIVKQFEENREQPLYYARGDYIHPLFGPDGEQLTDDYSLNHPHHRGVSWSWPVVRWKDEVRDLWAVRVLPTQPGGVWARPVKIRRILAGPVLAVIDAENVWKWGDQDPIVREEVVIRAFRQTDRCRFVDVTVRLTALVDDVSIGGRPKAGYGGFALRTFPEFQDRRITMRIDPPEQRPRRARFHVTGRFPGGKRPAGVVMVEHPTNPGYPNYPNPNGLDGIPDEYPPWRCVLPCFPGDREVPLHKDRPLVLEHRLWVHSGTTGEQTLVNIWTAYARPPTITIRDGKHE